MTKKRILAMTLSLLLILCLSGCGRKEASLGTESTAITETSDAAAETRFLINGAEELTDEQIDTALKRWIDYYGLDLPAVIDAMKPAVKEVIGDSDNIRYCEVDATNYSSLRKALEGGKGRAPYHYGGAPDVLYAAGVRDCIRQYQKASAGVRRKMGNC